ncbi:MAG: DNA recombination protein RmuC [Planctomycetota bacterium]
MVIVATTVLVLILFVLGLVVWLIISISASRREAAGQTAVTHMLQQQLEGLKAAQDNLREAVGKNLEKGQEGLTAGLQANQRTLLQLNSQIGELQGTNKQMLQVGREVRRLQDIMASPKMRGQLGEWSLENLLKTILPGSSFVLQHQFSNGQIVDALIKMADYSVPIDAKFPLPAFEALLKTEDEEEKGRLRRGFHRDVMKHIDKIAESYIRPGEGTLDFALMYIPAENVYYETAVKYDSDKTDLVEYGMKKRVIAVSPNMLYAYLMTIVMGLHGLQIEKQAELIRQNLRKLNGSFADFMTKWDVLGKHLRNAQSQYEESNQKLGRFGMELTQIQGSEEKLE